MDAIFTKQDIQQAVGMTSPTAYSFLRVATLLGVVRQVGFRAPQAQGRPCRIYEWTNYDPFNGIPFSVVNLHKLPELADLRYPMLYNFVSVAKALGRLHDAGRYMSHNTYFWRPVPQVTEFVNVE